MFLSGKFGSKLNSGYFMAIIDGLETVEMEIIKNLGISFKVIFFIEILKRPNL